MLDEKCRKNLDVLFAPSTVAVVGASDNPDKLGFHVMKSLTQGGFAGRILPINPGSEEIMDIRAFPSLESFNDRIDLAVIVVPAQVVPRVFEDCKKKRVRGIVLITAGFKEIDAPEGGRLQASLAGTANNAEIAVVGPNTFGILNVHKKLNATFTPEFSLVKKGGVALVSQSGGISHLLAFRAIRENVGISKIIGLGNRLNVDFADILPFLVDDPETSVIAMYIEGLDEPVRLLREAESVRGKKPIIVYKTGSAEAGDRASLSHTGTMAGKPEIYAGALKQAGILSVGSSRDLLTLSKAMTICSLPDGPRVAVLTGQAGPGMAACDVCEKEGMEISSFTPETQARINTYLPPLALRSNPVDMGPSWYDSSAVKEILKAAMEDDNTDGIILLMMFASANRQTVPNMIELLLDWKQKKPVITCFIAPPGIWEAELNKLENSGAAVNAETPEDAARLMAHLWSYSKLQKNVK